MIRRSGRALQARVRAHPTAAAALGAALTVALIACLIAGLNPSATADAGAVIALITNAALVGVAVFGVFPLLRQAVAASAEAESNRGSVDLQAIADVMYGDWVAGELCEGESLTLFGVETSKVRRARAVVLTNLRTTTSRGSHDDHEVEDWWDRWEMESAFKPADQPERPEAHLAFHLADKLEYIGLMCFAGAIPLRLVLPAMATVVVEDWALARHWIVGYCRHVDVARSVVVDGREERVYFHRRHADWLAMIALLWMRTYFPTFDIAARLAPVGMRNLTLDHLGHRIQALSAATGPVMLGSVRRDIRDLVGVELSQTPT